MNKTKDFLVEAITEIAYLRALNKLLTDKVNSNTDGLESRVDGHFTDLESAKKEGAIKGTDKLNKAINNTLLYGKEANTFICSTCGFSGTTSVALEGAECPNRNCKGLLKNRPFAWVEKEYMYQMLTCDTCGNNATKTPKNMLKSGGNCRIVTCIGKYKKDPSRDCQERGTGSDEGWDKYKCSNKVCVLHEK